MSNKKLTKEQVKHIARLANITVSDKLIKKLQTSLSITFEYISKLEILKTKGVKETSQVTGLENVYRDDVLEKDRMLSQEQALSNAKRTYNGYFVVERVLDK